MRTPTLPPSPPKLTLDTRAAFVAAKATATPETAAAAQTAAAYRAAASERAADDTAGHTAANAKHTAAADAAQIFSKI